PAQASTKHFILIAILFLLVIPEMPTPIPGNIASLLIFLLEFAFFLIPSVLATAKLGAMFPVEGGYYIWAHKAFGPFWDVLFVFSCYWFPPLLLAALALVVPSFVLQTLFTQLGYGEAPPWLMMTSIVMMFVITWGIGHLQLRVSFKILEVIVYAFLA